MASISTVNISIKYDNHSSSHMVMQDPELKQLREWAQHNLLVESHDLLFDAVYKLQKGELIVLFVLADSPQYDGQTTKQYNCMIRLGFHEKFDYGLSDEEADDE